MLTLKQRIKQFRHSLADIDALPQLTLLGVLVGILSGLLIIAFRLLIELPLSISLPGHSENFEGLPRALHFILPVAGALLIGIALHYIPEKFRDVSVGNVLERFHNYQGRMPAGNFLVQFFGGILCLISGQSVGREGPAVHIGASAASLFGQWLQLPNNSLRTLIGCGVAAAIAASFDTPVAGVIFAMEVVLMNYSIIGFIPIMMAAVCGAFITRLTFGEAEFFTATDLNMHGLWEIPLMIIAGLIIGLVATLYMRLQLGFSRFRHYPIALRVIAAGCVTGLLALVAPEILGLGYDTVNMALDGNIAFQALVVILLAKLLATTFSIAMGMPGGLIGPQLFLGACIGAIIGNVVNLIFPDSVSNSGFYVLLGMAAMMGSVINAPLAALMAVLELTYNPSVMFPSMLIIVVSCLTTRQLFQCEGIFIEQLKIGGKSLDASPAQQILSNIGVRSAMKTAFVECQTEITLAAAKHHLENNPLWIVIHSKDQQKILLRASDLAVYLASEHPALQQPESIDLLEIPGQRFTLSPIHELATLYEAQQLLHHQQADALFVTPQVQSSPEAKVLGIITHNTIENHYKL